MSKKPSRRKDDTRLAHSGREPMRFHGFVNPPIYRGSTILFPTVEALDANTQDFTYGRLGTPTVRALEQAIAELEGGHATLLTPSGLSAIATTLLAFVGTGDHILITDAVYRPTRRFCDNMLKRLGVETTYYDPLIGAGIKDLIRPNTKVVFAELPGSQTFEVQDIPAIAGGGACARRDPGVGQYLGDTALLQVVRAWRGRLDPRRHQIYCWPCRRHARRPHRNEGSLSRDRPCA